MTKRQRATHMKVFVVATAHGEYSIIVAESLSRARELLKHELGYDIDAFAFEEIDTSKESMRTR